MSRILNLLQPLLNKRILSIRNDGKARRMVMGWETPSPWIHVGDDDDPTNPTMGDCWLFNDCFWRHVGQMGMVHTNCHTCFKVVFRPRNYEEAVMTTRWQQTQPYAAKTGIDLRGLIFAPQEQIDVSNRATFGMWGAYWYCVGQKLGMERYQYVWRWVRDRLGLDRADDVILKRACTEFERTCGPSHLWQISSQQNFLERELSDNMSFIPACGGSTQPESIRAQSLQLWRQVAYAVGDKTWDFEDKTPLEQPYVTYHGKARWELEMELLEEKLEYDEGKEALYWWMFHTAYPVTYFNQPVKLLQPRH
jgi:hypothetical protein